MNREKSFCQQNCESNEQFLLTAYTYSLDREINRPNILRATSTLKAIKNHQQSRQTPKKSKSDSFLFTHFVWIYSDNIYLNQFKQQITPCQDLLAKSPNRNNEFFEVAQPSQTAKHVISKTEICQSKYTINKNAPQHRPGPSDCFLSNQPGKTCKDQTRYLEETLSNSGGNALPYPACFAPEGITEHLAQNQILAGQPQNPNQRFLDIKHPELKKLIEASVDPQVSFNNFDPHSAFIAKVKREFGHRLNDQTRVKPFNFLPLKVVWSQFLSGERVSPDYLKQFTGFEHLLFRTFMLRCGYKTNVEKLELDPRQLQTILQSTLRRNSERDMLQTALKAVYKKLMHSFSRQKGQKPFHSSMGVLRLDRAETSRFYSHYFGAESSEADHLSERILGDSWLMIGHIAKMGRSERMCTDVLKFLRAPQANPHLEMRAQRRYSISQSAALRRHKYDIADQINKRTTNYEIVLNQFDPDRESARVLRWMGTILRDLKLNPRVRLPCDAFQLEECFQLLLRYLLSENV